LASFVGPPRRVLDDVVDRCLLKGNCATNTSGSCRSDDRATRLLALKHVEQTLWILELDLQFAAHPICEHRMTMSDLVGLVGAGPSYKDGASAFTATT